MKQLASAAPAPYPGTMTILNRAEALSRASTLLPALRARAATADRDRRVADENIAAITGAGLFRLMAPREFGGSQLGLASLIEVTAELASGCGSTGWIYAVLAGHNWLLGLFPTETQREVFEDPDALVASVVRLGGERPKRISGGVRIANAKGGYCSGIDHSAWILVGAGVEDAEGAVVPTYLLVPRADVEVVDDWFTSGMRGTGSRSIVIREAFVPDRRAVPLADMAQGTAPGTLHHDAPLYRAPFPQILPITLAGAPLGIARGGVAAFIEKFRAKISGWPEEQIGEQGGVFMRVTEAAAEAAAAFALVLKTCEGIDALPDGTRATPLERAGYLRDISHAAWRCRSAVNSLFEASGGSGIFDSQDLQRIWRDINAAAAHNSFVRERAAGMYGRAALGLPPSRFDRIGH